VLTLAEDAQLVRDDSMTAETAPAAPRTAAISTPTAV